MNRTSFRVIFGLKILKTFQSLKAISEEGTFSLEKLIELILLEIAIIL